MSANRRLAAIFVAARIEVLTSPLAGEVGANAKRGSG
jgi:hypothetical protein